MTGRRYGVDGVLPRAVLDGTVPHAVVVSADRTGQRHETAVGPRTHGSSEPIRADSVFRLASMTKIFTAVAVVRLRDLGALDLDAPVEDYRPEFAAVQVLDGFDGDRPRLRDPAGRATVRQLLEHTAGFGYDLWHPELIRWAEAGGPGRAPAGLRGTFAQPMLADPGTRAGYGVGFDWLGLVVESVTGQNLAGYLAEHVFDPLGMTDTGFGLPADRRRRLVPVHVRDASGGWVPTDIGWERRDEACAGGHGLYSTPRDVLSLLRMLLGAGTVDGVTVLSSSSALEMFADHTAGLPGPARRPSARPTVTTEFPVEPGTGWGWGLAVGQPAPLSPRGTGDGGWAGIFNTFLWVDRRRGLTGALFSQCLPFATPAVLRLRAEVERARHASRPVRPASASV